MYELKLQETLEEVVSVEVEHNGYTFFVSLNDIYEIDYRYNQSGDKTFMSQVVLIEIAEYRDNAYYIVGSSKVYNEKIISKSVFDEIYRMGSLQ